jgi:hypothetical protein
MTTLEHVLDELAQRIGAVVVERLRAGEPGMMDQSASPLGSRRHCAAVKRRIARGERGAALVGRKHLLSPEALSEELGRASKREVPATTEPGGVRAELERQIRMVRSAGANNGR